MVAAMYHRGPDDNGTYFDSKISLGMTRLAILDTTHAGHQPMTTPDEGVSIIYNGETYNFRSERSILESKGHSFKSKSDTEVILKMYLEYGDDFLKRMRGMFALAIYDKRRGFGRERLLLARDQFGIKPLLYADSGNKLVFASEIKTLLASGLVEPAIDPEGLRLFLTFGSVCQPRTIIKGVKMLMPAHRMIVEDGKTKTERYWSLDTDRHPGLRDAPYEEQVAEIEAILEETVKLQMVSDVPIGAFLSGGIDSSLMVAMMSEASSERIKTFSVGFDGKGSDIDESEEAAITAEFLGTDHTRVKITEHDVRDHIERFAFGLDQPSSDGINTYFVSMAARKGVTVAISGNGGDELFAGYPWFIFMQKDIERHSESPFSSRIRESSSSFFRNRFFDRFIPGALGQAVFRLRNIGGFLDRYGANSWQLLNASDAASLIATPLRREAKAGKSMYFDLREIDEIPHGSTIERVSALSLRGYNNNQLLRDSDAVSMFHSLELRVPFLDPLVADAALSLPDESKIKTEGDLDFGGELSYRDTGAKRILLDIGKKMLPKDFDKKPKRGFGMPFESWLRGGLREVYLDTLSSKSVNERGLLDAGVMDEMKSGFENGNLEALKIWAPLILELWCREVLDKPVPHDVVAEQKTVS